MGVRDRVRETKSAGGEVKRQQIRIILRRKAIERKKIVPIIYQHYPHNFLELSQ